MSLIVYLIVLGLAALEITHIGRKLDAKVCAGVITADVARRKIGYQWRLWIGLALIYAVAVWTYH